MGNLFYIIAISMFIAWVIGYAGYGMGGINHSLLVVAIIATILQIIQKDNNKLLHTPHDE